MHIHFMEADDWKVMYVDGKRIMRGHSLRLENVIEAICPDVVVTSSWHDADAEILGVYGKEAPEELPEEYEYRRGIGRDTYE